MNKYIKKMTNKELEKELRNCWYWYVCCWILALITIIINKFVEPMIEFVILFSVLAIIYVICYKYMAMVYRIKNKLI